MYPLGLFEDSRSSQPETHRVCYRVCRPSPGVHLRGPNGADTSASGPEKTNSNIRVSEAFNFNEDDPEGVTIFDVQGLFQRLQTSDE